MFCNYEQHRLSLFFLGAAVFIGNTLMEIRGIAVVDAFVPAAIARVDAGLGNAQSTALHMIPVLDEWKLLPNGRIEGKVVMHDEVEAGTIISTSPLLDPTTANGENILVQTFSGSEYRLLYPISQRKHDARGTRPVKCSRSGDILMEGDDHAYEEKPPSNVAMFMKDISNRFQSADY